MPSYGLSDISLLIRLRVMHITSDEALNVTLTRKDWKHCTSRPSLHVKIVTAREYALFLVTFTLDC
jgi:hypothetical protein